MLAKIASKTTAKNADVITYWLVYSNPGSAIVNNATLTDVLPPAAAMTYVAGSASNGGVYNATANSLTWNIPTISGGASVSFSYGLQVQFLAGKYSPMVNNATLSYAGGSVKASSSVTFLGTYKETISIYNEAGELIKTIVGFNASGAINAFDVMGGPITSDQGAVSFFYNNQSLGAWDATNGNGGKVTNGAYTVKIDSTDPYNVTTTVTHTVMVSIARSILTVKIFNEAGEVVKHFTTEDILNMLANSPAGAALLPSDYNVGSTKLSSTLIQPSYADPSNPGNYVTITLGSGRSFTWNGTGDNGKILTSGHYFIEVDSAVQNGAKEETIMGITIQNHGASPISGFVLVPNPVNMNQNNTAIFQVNVDIPQVDSVHIRIYTIAGELVQILKSPAGNATQVSWDLGMTRMASGTYLAVAELYSNGALVGRKITRAVVYH